MEEETGKALQSEETSETTEQIPAAQAPEAALTAKGRTHDKMHGGWMRFKREWNGGILKRSLRAAERADRTFCLRFATPS